MNDETPLGKGGRWKVRGSEMVEGEGGRFVEGGSEG
jgi:hypothetical protein